MSSSKEALTPSEVSLPGAAVVSFSCHQVCLPTPLWSFRSSPPVRALIFRGALHSPLAPLHPGLCVSFSPILLLHLPPHNPSASLVHLELAVSVATAFIFYHSAVFPLTTPFPPSIQPPGRLLVSMYSITPRLQPCLTLPARESEP